MINECYPLKIDEIEAWVAIEKEKKKKKGKAKEEVS